LSRNLNKNIPYIALFLKKKIFFEKKKNKKKLGVHQHSLQQNKIVYLSRNLEQNMPKNGLFFTKNL